jgi:hypothetical protein
MLLSHLIERIAMLAPQEKPADNRHIEVVLHRQ